MNPDANRVTVRDGCPQWEAKRRKRFFSRHCPVREVDATVFHGTPLSGLLEIKRAGRLIPQGHAELPSSEWLSVSVNDNVLRLFSESKHMIGFASDVKLSVAHLDPFHHSLAAADSGACDPLDSEEEILAFRLGHVSQRSGEALIDDRGLRELIGELDGLVFPWTRWCPMVGLHFGEWNSEAEIALNDAGCEKVWAGIHTLWIDGDEMEAPKGWRKIAKLAKHGRIPQPAW